jgi:hypothetical protein
MSQQPALKQHPNHTQWRGSINLGLAYLCELTAKMGQVRASSGAYKALKMLDLMAATVD